MDLAMRQATNMTRHAKNRSQQRAIPQIAIDLLLEFGRVERAGDGASKVYLDKTAKKRLKAYAGPIAGHLESLLDIYAVVSAEQRVITVARRLERIERN